MPMSSRSFLGLGPSGFHRVAYREWGEPAARRTIVCAHGLTRNGRDFDDLAAALAADGHRVLCPDFPGRAASDPLPRAEDYGFELYCTAMVGLIARSGAETVDWVGTSMGGIVGMLLAARPGSPIRRLVLNDVGAVVAAEGLRRIAGYAPNPKRHADFDAACAAIRLTAATFGPFPDEAAFRRFVAAGLRREPDGSWVPDYDPAIAATLAAPQVADIDLRPVWDAIRCPVLVVRGAESDLFTAATVAEMKGRGPGCDVVEVPGVGHCPALMDTFQIDTVRAFLED